IILIGLVILTLSVIYDIVSVTARIPYLPLTLSGMTFLILSFAWLLGNRYTELYNRLDEETNLLEVKVRERTEELRDAIFKLQERNKQHEKDLRLARVIQMNLLPDQPENLEGLRFVAHYLPMDDLGGDFYDIFPFSQTKTGFLLTDVAGHGVAAALVSMMLKLAFTSEAKNDKLPAEVLTQVNDSMMSHLTTGEFFTCVYGVLDRAKQSFIYASGGHLPVLHYKKRDHQIYELENTGPIMGFRRGVEFENKEIKVQEGDRLIFYTDGVIEARNAREDEFGLDRLKETLLKYSESPLDRSVQALMRELYSYSGDWTVQDDFTLFIVEIVQL
ncbi:MAG: hypothetical protein D6767_01605, partial [Candidatus Hydrogenedentota bacterium]